jgi:hypothetical protein
VVINEATEEKALLDSGASGNFIHEELVKQLELPRHRRTTALPVTDIQGRPLRTISKYTTLFLQAGTHQEQATFNIITLGKHKLVLGLTWLQKHDPSIKWSERKISFNSALCKRDCIKNKYPKQRKEPDRQRDKDIPGLMMTDEETEIFSIKLPSNLKPTETKDTDAIPREYKDFLDVFDTNEAKKMPKDRGIWNFTIDFIDKWEDKLPRPSKRYQLSMAEQQLERDTIKELLDSGMIRPSKSPLAAPCFFVPKKDGTKRHVVDWRGINAITIKDAHPLPIMDDLLDLARGSKIMSKLDLTASYNQIPIRESDRWKTAFITSQGLFEFNVMHFGFTNAPPHMQRYMQHVLASHYPRKVRVYLDDIPAFSGSLQEHVKTMRGVLASLRENRLFAKAKKCDFHKTEMELLGVKVTTKGFKMEEKKISEVRDWKPPKNVRGIRSFLGFCNFYRRFIKNFALIARPLHDLEQKDYKWRWNQREQDAFDQLKKLVTSEPVLAHADPDLPYRMETDASNYAYGAVLSQKKPEEPRHPVAYMSKSMNTAERNYDIGNKETLGIVKPLQHWRHWLEGTKQPIEILTDHKNLVNFSKPQILNQRQARWLQELQKYNFVIKYRPGSKNSAADALSR